MHRVLILPFFILRAMWMIELYLLRAAKNMRIVGVAHSILLMPFYILLIRFRFLSLKLSVTRRSKKLSGVPPFVKLPLLPPQERPLVFLKMISDKEGFVLEHAQVIEKDVNTITLKCHHLYKDTPHSWSLSYLFSYTIPSYLVFPQSSDRLYEGFLPFIPWYDSTAVYFVDYKGSDAGIYGYSLKTHEVSQVVKPVHNSLYCAPILIGKNLIYGDNSARMEYQDGQLHIEMPSIPIKIK